jgi:hypothetical protein
MPKGPSGEKRAADAVGAAVMVARIATGEIEEKLGPREPKPGKDAPAADLGERGGAARARKLTPEQRREIARKGAASRWGRQE